MLCFFCQHQVLLLLSNYCVEHEEGCNTHRPGAIAPGDTNGSVLIFFDISWLDGHELVFAQ